MKDAYFISDLHFGTMSETLEKKKLEKLFSFLSHINHQDNILYIVGDLFDYWFEYKHFILKKHFKLLYKFHELIRNGVEIHFLPGNHDYWTRSFLNDEVGIKVHKEEIKVELQNKLFYLFHGDGIASYDRGYRLLKKIIRNPVNIFLYSLIHPDLGASIADFASRTSREYTTDKHNAINDKNECIKFAEKYHQQGFDCVILGHTHRPFIHEKSGKYVLNLGDWITNFTYGKFSNNKISLEKWDF